MPYYTGTPDAGDEGQRPCARGIWCAARTVTTDGVERTVQPALTYQAFCRHDWDLVANCISDLPAIYGRLQQEISQPAITETTVHVPFGPSIPLRLDVDAAMRLTATRLAVWEARVRATGSISDGIPYPAVSAEGVAQAAHTLATNTSILLALQPAFMAHNVPLHPGRRGQPASVSEDVLEEYGDAEILRVGADFIGLFVECDGAAAGLEFLHLHYWCRAVLRETPARPEELLGVECRSCSLLTLRRAEPPWHDGDPEFYSECENCGDLMPEHGDDGYRAWVALLHAYHRAHETARPVLGPAPLASSIGGSGGRA